MIEMQSAAHLGPQGWNQAIAGLPGAHVLQTWQWGQFKTGYGWSPSYYLWRDGDRDGGRVVAAALVLARSAPGGLKVLYLPRGPLLAWEDEGLRSRVLDDLQGLARQNGV